MGHSKLSSHIFKKGKFITPINAIPTMEELSDEKSWTYGRLPEYLWIGLVFKWFGREKGLQKLDHIITKLHDLAPELLTARMSQILRLDTEKQKEFYRVIVNIGAKQALAPLTIFLTDTYAPEFSTSFYCPEMSIEDRCNSLTEAMYDLMNHQSYESTDIRFVALYFYLLSGKVHLQYDQFELLGEYPTIGHENELMKMARPSIRALEATILTFEQADSEFIQHFWGIVSEMTECSIFSIQFPEETRNAAKYMEKIHEIFSYLAELFTAANPIDEKMNVLLGIATYSYKRVRELYEHNMFNSIAARSCVRVLIENYIMMKYLVKNEATHANIWREYQVYGLGAYKLVLTKSRERGIPDDAHFDMKFVEMLVNEFKGEEFIDMDTRYFDKQGIREKAVAVGEQDLYGLYYDYDSSFEHGLWGAVRESSLLKCNNPAHKYHCVPDVDATTRLKTVLPDCVIVMNKTIEFLNQIYGIPEQLLDEVMSFEIEPFTE